MIKWGIMALGTIAEKFAYTLQQKGEGRLYAVASRSLEKAEAFASKYGDVKYFGSYEELCNCKEVDAIYISTPNNMHFENCRQALEAGKHVLCEKPFTTNTQQAKELYSLAEEKGLFIMEALWIYHLPLLKKAAELVAKGEIGDVNYVRADYGFTAEGARRERKFLSSLGGGALLDVGVYNLAFAKMIYRKDPVNIKTDRILNEYGTDSFGTLLADYGDNKFAALTSAIGIKMPTEGVIYGTKGKIYFPNYQKAEYMKITYNDGTEKEYNAPFEINGFEYQIEEAEKCILSHLQESPNYPHQESIGIMQSLEDIRKLWGMKFEFE